MGGTTIHANRTYIDVPRTESLQGTYQVRGTNLHFTLKYPPPAEKISPFQIDGQKLTIDGKVYDRL
jgi:hypothetical protein